MECPEDCNGNGNCENHKCICEDTWYGESCKLKECPNNCNSRGTCDSASGVCDCEDPFCDDDCSGLSKYIYSIIIS